MGVQWASRISHTTADSTPPTTFLRIRKNPASLRSSSACAPPSFPQTCRTRYANANQIRKKVAATNNTLILVIIIPLFRLGRRPCSTATCQIIDPFLLRSRLCPPEVAVLVIVRVVLRSIVRMIAVSLIIWSKKKKTSKSRDCVASRN
jgi:hypothetical protein